MVESAAEVKKNEIDEYLPEKSTPEAGGEELSQSDQRILAASENDTSLEEKFDISVPSKEEALISLDDAQATLGPEILRVLDEKFKGTPTQIRQVDERDQIF
ncbi:MAG: hypothetical protein VXU48_01025 [Verrucomicrobiota bacterium]|nr:hypothetical protein [Verrucomicrobiota bacterium]